MFDLSDYEKCEELRKSKSRSKKNHSKFTLARCRQPGTTVGSPSLAAALAAGPGMISLCLLLFDWKIF